MLFVEENCFERELVSGTSCANWCDLLVGPTQVTDKVHYRHNSILNLTSPRAEVAYLTVSLPWRSSNKLAQRIWTLISTNRSATSC